MTIKHLKTLAAAALAVGLYALVTSPLPEAAVSRVKTWGVETLTSADLNAEFDNILNNGEDLGWPATKAKDLDGQELIVDSDGDTSITADTDDRLDFRAGGQDIVRFDGTTASSVNFFDLASRATGVAPALKSRGEANVGLTLQDSNGNEALILGATASAVNEITITNKATGVAPTIQASGEANIGLGLLDSNGNEIVIGASVASAVNEVTVTNAATGNAPQIAATGGDTNIDINLVSKGTGVVQSNGATVVPTLGTEQATTSGTSIDFTSIPSWVKRVVIMARGVSTNGTDLIIIQIGTGGSPETSGYVGSVGIIGGSTGSTSAFANGFEISSSNVAAAVYQGVIAELFLENASANAWASKISGGRSDTPAAAFGGGTKTLSGAFDMIRMTTGGGTDTFDAGAVNIQYE